MSPNVFVDLKSVENVLVFETGDEVLLNYIRLVKFESIQMVLSHVSVILGPFKLLQSFDNIWKHFNLFLFGQFGIEIISLERLFQQWQHNQVRNEKIIVSFSRLRLQKQVFIQSFIVDNAFHSLEVTVVELCGQILGIAGYASHPSLLALRLISRKIQSHCFVVQ